MGSMNRVVLIGRLGQDPELRQGRSGSSWCTFNVATKRHRKDADGGYTEEADWHQIRAFGQQAETVVKFLRRGSMCSVEGSLHYDKWQDDNGNRRVAARIHADRVHFLADTRRASAPPVDGHGFDLDDVHDELAPVTAEA